jgi:hypothetical protein
MRKLYIALLAAVVVTGTALAQTPAPAPAPAKAPPAATAAPAAAAPAGTVKAIQPGLLEVSGPRVNEVQAAGIKKITATPGKGSRAIVVESPWGYSYFGFPKDVKPVAFTIEVGKPAGVATISAPGFKEANKADYKSAIEAIIPFAVRWTNDIHKLATQ